MCGRSGATRYVRAVRPLPHPPIRTVHAGGVHVDHDLARFGDGVRNVAVLQDLRAAMRFEKDRLHVTPPVAWEAVTEVDRNDAFISS